MGVGCRQNLASVKEINLCCAHQEQFRFDKINLATTTDDLDNKKHEETKIENRFGETDLIELAKKRNNVGNNY